MNIYGASGHGKVIIDIVKTNKGEIHYVFDDDDSVDQLLGYKVEHKILSDFLKEKTILAIGDNRIRKSIAGKFKGDFNEAVIHSSAVVDASCKLGNGTVVMGTAVINSSAVIGAHCIINTGAIVEHDCVISDYVHISPNATLAGGVHIGEGSHCGIGAMVIPGVKIGNWVTIGAGSVVLKDIPDNAIVVGNPGKIIKFRE